MLYLHLNFGFDFGVYSHLVVSVWINFGFGAVSDGAFSFLVLFYDNGFDMVAIMILRMDVDLMMTVMVMSPRLQ